MPEKSSSEINKKLKTQLLFYMLYFLGLRIHEINSHNWGCFRLVNGKWWFFVRGKGHKDDRIPVNDKLLSFVKMYRIHIGNTPIPYAEEKEAFFLKKNGDPVKIQALYRCVKNVGIEASKLFIDNPSKKNKLLKFSPHWSRHLLASHLDKNGISATVIQSIMRHTSIQTTQMYIHAQDDLKHSESQKIDMHSYSDTSKATKLTELILKIEFSYVLIAADEFVVRSVIDAVERNAFNGIRYEWMGETKQSFLTSLKEPLRISRKFILNYAVFLLDADDINRIKRTIVMESEIRLFKCEFI